MNPARSLLILADDLTGAADSAIGAARAGLNSFVLFEENASVNAEAIAIDSDTRYQPETQARATVTQLWAKHRAPDQLFYKKIDSTLRGNFAAEISALTAAGLAIVAPAFPANGRTTIGGRVYVRGAPLETTEIWANERLQGEADITAMLQRAGISATKLTLEDVRSNTLRSRFEALLASGTVQAVVCDAEHDSDLAAVAQASVGLPKPVYWAGSSILPTYLIDAAGLKGHSSRRPLSFSGPILTIVGSISSISRQQVAELETHHNAAILVADAEMLRHGDSDPAWRSMRTELETALRSGRDTILRTRIDAHNDLTQGRALCQSLARMLEPVAESVGALIVTGGETARTLLPVFGIQALQVLDEIEAGIPISRTVGAREIPIVTKAGAFGSPHAFVKAYAKLAEARKHSPANH